MAAKLVITTIQEPTASVLDLAKFIQSPANELIVIGDEKGPFSWSLESSRFYSLEAQRELPFELEKYLPTNSYSRKNLGYLEAIRFGASSIFETDDDNSPLGNWQFREYECSARRVEAGGWINVYRYFTEEQIWPRGFPITQIRQSNANAPGALGVSLKCKAPVQQSLVSGSPDVDAIWRLIMDREVHFRQEESLFLPAGAWCPFNSQSTWWFPEAYPLMYLPSFVSFRMTDIWRSFVAQRCLWEMGYGVIFHGPEMFQDRNFHNLAIDFEQEIPGYLGNDAIARALEDTSLNPGKSEVAANLKKCYEALEQLGVVSSKELQLLDCWLEDLSKTSSEIFFRAT